MLFQGLGGVLNDGGPVDNSLDAVRFARGLIGEDGPVDSLLGGLGGLLDESGPVDNLLDGLGFAHGLIGEDGPVDNLLEGLDDLLGEGGPVGGPLGGLGGDLSDAGDALSSVVEALSSDGLQSVIQSVGDINVAVASAVANAANFAAPLTEEIGGAVAEAATELTDAFDFLIAPAGGEVSNVIGPIADGVEGVLADTLGTGLIFLPNIDVLGVADVSILGGSNSATDDVDVLLGIDALPDLNLPLGGLGDVLSGADSALGVSGLVDISIASEDGLALTVDIFDAV